MSQVTLERNAVSWMTFPFAALREGRDDSRGEADAAEKAGSPRRNETPLAPDNRTRRIRFRQRRGRGLDGRHQNARAHALGSASSSPTMRYVCNVSTKQSR